MMTTVVVFGGAGFLGRRLVHRLSTEGMTVRVAVRHPDRAQIELRSMGFDRVTVIPADVRDQASVSAAIAEANAVVNAVSAYVEKGGVTFESVCAKQDCLMLQQRAGLAVFEHPFGDVTGLIRLIAHADEPWPLTSRAVRPEILREALSRETDDGVSRRQNWLRRTIVLVERNNAGRRTELTGEVEDVAHCRCAKRIDCLCIVTDDRQPTAGRLQRQ
jgi:hypothetical protein